METLKKILDIPENHKLHFDVTLPESFPSGLAEVLLVFSPHATSFSLKNHSADFLQLAGALKNSPHFKEDPLKIQKGFRDEWE